ncbi:MAG: hypothetical protein AAGD10_00580 [Myxococcota bacterium]
MKDSIDTSQLLQEEVQEELARREGHWTAFSTQLFERLDKESRQAEAEGLEARAVAQLAADVDQSLVELEPRMAKAFREEVEARVFRSGMSPEPWWRRRWLHLMPAPLALAAAAALLLVVPTPEMGPRGVVVERLSVEGAATVFADEGVTVVWMEVE